MIRNLAPDVVAIFDKAPPPAGERLLEIRALIFRIAEDDTRIGNIVETLKWGQPAYLTVNPKSGTTIRLGWTDKYPDHVSLFVHCQTSLVEDWRHLYEDRLTFIGNRELRLDINAPLPMAELQHCIAMALTYHVQSTA